MSDEHRVDRRGFLQCMTWAGTGVLWSVTGGVLSSRTLGVGAAEAQTPSASFNFVQISDTHIGFKGEANKDVMGSFEAAIARIKALDPKPSFLIHTGDITHAQKAGAFDTVSEALKGTGVERTFYVPGENDVFADGGTEYLNRFADEFRLHPHIKLRHQVEQLTRTAEDAGWSVFSIMSISLLLCATN